MTSCQLITLLGFGVATLVAVVALRQVGVAPPVVLVLAGLVTGFLPFAPDLAIKPDVVLLGLLPLLVFQTAVTSSPTAFLRHARPIGLSAVALVMTTAACVAAVAHGIGGLPWPIAFVLGAAVCPTDPSAATGIARTLGLPRRVVTIMEGEALLNDVTALVLLAAAVSAATTGRFSALHTAGAILYAVVVGGAIGLVAGYAGMWARKRIDDPSVEIASSIMLAYAAYLPAEVLHASGVLATSVAGLYVGWHRSTDAISARSRLQSAAFWESLVFLIDGVLFVLVGLSFHTFRGRAIGPGGGLILTGCAVVVTVMAVRLGWMLLLGPRGKALERSDDASHESDWGERLILGWSGMRGAITLAAILSVPEVTDRGHPLSGRDDVVYLGFAVILATLVIQGMTLPALARRLRLAEHPAGAEAERRARLELTQAALDYLDATAPGEIRDEIAVGLRLQYVARLHRLQGIVGESDLTGAVRQIGDSELRLRRDLNAVQRRALHALRHKRRIGATAMRVIERDLDLEEARLAADA